MIDVIFLLWRIAEFILNQATVWTPAPVSKTLKGKKNVLTATIVSRDAKEIVADFVSVTPVFLGFKTTTKYRASIKITENTATKLAYEIRQFPADSEKNKDMKNLISTRYAEEVTVNGKKYTYIRVYSVNDIDASSLSKLSGVRNMIQSSSEDANMESLQLVIDAAKKK